jgi:hypothetical protein
MSKRRKHRRRLKSPATARQQNELAGTPNLAGLPWLKRLGIFYFSNWILMTFLILYDWRHNYHLDFIHKLPFPLVSLYTVCFFLSVALLSSMTKKLERSMSRMRTDEMYSRKAAIILILYSFVPLTIFCIPLIYYSGVINTLAIYLNSQIPILGVTFNSLLLSFLSILISGVVGNAAYDLLKRIIKGVK